MWGKKAARTVPVFTAVSPSGVEQPPRLVTVIARIKAFTKRDATCLERNALPLSRSEQSRTPSQPQPSFGDVTGEPLSAD